MTDKVRIDNFGVNLENVNNETYLARQAEFESNVRSYPRKLPLAIAFGSLMLRIINILIAWLVRVRWLWVITILTSSKASKMSLPAACRYIPSILQHR